MASLRYYIITRLLLTIPMVLLLLSLIFVVLRVMPGDPVNAILGPKAPEEYKQQLRAQLGLDKPIHEQYIDYLVKLAHGDLGKSLWTRRPIAEEIMEYFPATLELTLSAMVIAVLIGVFTGAYSAYKRNSPADHTLRTYAIVVYSTPIFWLGLMLQLLFGVYLKWLPICGRADPLMEPTRITGLYVLDSLLTLDFPALVSSIRHLILPSITLGIVLSGIFVRMTRANMLDVLRQDYIAAARARGIPERLVVYKHALKNSLIPIVTMMGLQFALLLGGAVLTETVFSWHGMGYYFIMRIYYRDFPAIQGATVFFALLVALVSLIVDVLYVYINPRVRY